MDNAQILESLRSGALSIFEQELAPHGGTHLAAELEQALYAHSIAHKQYYGSLLGPMRNLGIQYGDHPNDMLAYQLCRGVKSAAEVVAAAMTLRMPELDPRDKIRRMLTKTLVETCRAGGKSYKPMSGAPNTESIDMIDMARAIEVACFNNAIRASKESEDLFRRQWDSPNFVDIYSTRCGTINGILSHNSMTCREYDPAVSIFYRLFLPHDDPDFISAEALGNMTEKQLCPGSFEAERREIARRSIQEVKEKESNLFRCPHCGERKSSYREVQKRSLDEAPDYKCVCLNPKCGRRFKGQN